MQNGRKTPRHSNPGPPSTSRPIRWTPNTDRPKPNGFGSAQRSYERYLALAHAPRPREAANHFLGLTPVLDEPEYQLRGFLAGQNPVYLFRRYRRRHFGAQFVNLAKGQPPSEIPSHSARVRLEHGGCFHDDDADRLAGFAANQQEVRHDLTVLLAP